jgi:drug/metabolite transporter (DMT)-like permease
VTILQIEANLYTVGILAGIIASLLFGISNVIYKSLDNEISILDISCLRIWISLPFSFIFIFLPFRTTPFAIPLEVVLPLSFSMIVAIIIGDGLYFMSQQRIGVARAYPIAMCFPLIVYALSIIFLGEPIIISRIVGAFLVVGGVGLIGRSYNHESYVSSEHNSHSFRIGVFLAFATAIAWAIGEVVFQYGLTSIDPLDGNLVRMLAGSIALLPAYILLRKKNRIKPTRRVIIITLITGIFGMGFSLLFGTFSVKYIGATVNSILLAAGPLFTTPISIVYLKEEVPLSLAAGTLFTILGVILVILAI